VSAPVQFYRGPYDGLVLDAERVRTFCHAVSSPGGSRTRRFLLMPPLREWGSPTTGRRRKGGRPGTLHPYELVTRGERPEVHHRDFSEFAEAMGEG
jgi:hypothetical protein